MVAQDGAPAEQEAPGSSRGGYAWGAAPSDEQDASQTAEPWRRYGLIHLQFGLGGTIRIVAHADVCNPDVVSGCRFSPPYLQLRGGYLFETTDTWQMGVGLGVATNLTEDGDDRLYAPVMGQWTFSPNWLFRHYVDDWWQVLAVVGLPLAVTGNAGTDASREAFAFNWGFEVQLGVIFKFLTGLGVYAAANVTTFFAGTDSVWPTASLEGGVVFDYEVLP